MITLGGLLLLGMLTDLIGRRTRLPRVTLLVLFGVAIGPSAADLLPANSAEWFEITASMALVMVGFLLGGGLSVAQLRDHGRQILVISGAKALGTYATVAVGLTLLGVGFEVAFLLAAVATATDPAATQAVVDERRGRGPFARTLLGVVALDDAWGLVLFSVTLALIESVAGTGASSAILLGVREIGGALLLGVALGVPAAYLTGRLEPGEPTLVEALGVVFLCGGLAMWLGVSFLIASMVLGATVATLAQHHRRPFHAIEGIEWPFIILFFVLAGASIDLRAVAGLGVLVVGYVALRSAGTVAGTWLGTRAERSSPALRRWLGLALLPQAGVALGMAVVAAERLPEHAGVLLQTTIAATVIFELVGPVLTRASLVRAGEASEVDGESAGGIAESDEEVGHL